jgi:membrane protease YdiL (CAAX protease family)
MRACGFTWAELGFRNTRAGLRLGVALSAIPVAVCAAGLAFPPTRRALAAAPLPPHPARWLLWEIPAGTVLAEELLFRSALPAAAGRVVGSDSLAIALGALAFGLWHVPGARRSGESVPRVLLATTAAGVVFDWAASVSIIAPLLAHLAVNESGAVAAILARRHR